MQHKDRGLKKVGIGLVLGTTLFLTSMQAASAAPGWREVYLGRLGTTDNINYWRSKGKFPAASAGSPPWDRNDLCRWKYGRSDVSGKSVSWFGADNWKTDCSYRYWQWW
jgi:hypothetical protein